MVVQPLDVEITALTNTTVHNREAVTYEVRVTNSSSVAQTGFLWFTVLLTGLDNEKPVRYPHIFEEMPFSGEIDAKSEAVLQFDAWPLSYVPRGLYIYWAKVGRFQNLFGEINIDAKSSFHGVILDEPGYDAGPEAGWIIGSVRAVNEAGAHFLSGEGGQGDRIVRLRQNYPNPFRPETWIAYEVRPRTGSTARIRFDVYNIHGQRVRALVDEEKPTGSYSVKWDGRDDRGVPVQSGVYIFRAQSGGDVSVRKGILTR